VAARNIGINCFIEVKFSIIVLVKVQKYNNVLNIIICNGLDLTIIQ
jgi:hypothetical protein